MTNALHIRQTGKHLQFLPNNFYEAPQYASFRPVRIPFSVPPPRPHSPSVPVIPAPKKHVRERKTLRTVSALFNADGRMTGAKIDLATGEVQQHDYKDYFDKGIRARPNPDAADLEPFWMQMPAASRSTGLPGQKDKSRKKQYNSVKMYLECLLQCPDSTSDHWGLSLWARVAEALPALVEIITNVNMLDLGGATRGLGERELLRMLASTDVISAHAVRELKEDCCPRHSQKIALSLRAIVNEFTRQVDGIPPTTAPKKQRQAGIEDDVSGQQLSTDTRLTPPKKEPCVARLALL